MVMLTAIVEIGDAITTYRPGTNFNVLDEDYAAMLISQKRAKRFEEHWDGLRWHGDTVCIIASGPSLTEEQCAAVRCWQGPGRKAIAINTSFRLAPWADLLYACDAIWWDQYFDEVKEMFKGQLWTQDEVARKKYGVRRIASQRGTGLSRQIGMIYQGMNSGYQAINLAFQAGVTRMILLGFDCRNQGRKDHWHGKHPAKLAGTSLPYASWIQLFSPLAADLKSEGIEVVNCSPDSALKSFPLLKLDEALV